MAAFTISLIDSSHHPSSVVEADAYQQEGPMLTFFAFAEDRSTIDSWSHRVASFRVSDVVSVWRAGSATRPVLRSA